MVTRTCLTFKMAAFTATFLLCLTGAESHASPIKVGNNDAPNSFPFGADNNGTRYQQVYSGSIFSGKVDILAIKFFDSDGPENIVAGEYRFELSTSRNEVNNLVTSNMDANEGSDETLFADVSLSGSFGSSLTINAGDGQGGSTFSYDPADGDLLLDITRTNTGADTGLFADATFSSNGVFSRAHDFGTRFDNTGLVTEFETSTPVTSVPIPSTLALLGAGLIGLGAAARRRYSI